MKKTYVIGHKNPDTDSIASAIAYAELKNRLGFNVIPRRLGTLNEETKFATKYFDVEAPDVMYDARIKLGEIELDEAIKIDYNSSCNYAYKQIIQSSTKTLFATKNDKLIGIVSISDLTSIKLMSNSEREALLSKSNISVITKDVSGQLLCEGPYDTNGKVTIYNDRIDSVDKHIVIANTPGALRDLSNKNPSIVIFSGHGISREMIELYQRKDISLIITTMSIEDIAFIIHEAVPVNLVMTTNMIVYSADEYIESIASKIISTRFRSYPVVSESGELIGSVSRYHLFNYEKNAFILVDHSSISQTIDNIDQAEIVEVVDHHHIGDIQTSTPIDYRNKTCGCTCSIIYQMFKENKIKPSQKAAGMMLSAIISDTLYFISNTTTVFDIDAANELAELLDVDLNAYARKLLSASVNLTNANIDELIQRDLKTYEINGNRLAIAQTNYNKMSDIQLRLNEFKEKLIEFQSANRLDLLIMMFTSVKADGTMFLFFGPKANVMLDIIETKFDSNSGFDSNILSRKQELVPKLSKALHE